MTNSATSVLLRAYSTSPSRAIRCFSRGSCAVKDHEINIVAASDPHDFAQQRGGPKRCDLLSMLKQHGDIEVTVRTVCAPGDRAEQERSGDVGLLTEPSARAVTDTARPHCLSIRKSR